MAGKPKYTVRAKSKSTGNKMYLLAFWENEKGISGMFDKTVAKIVLSDGKVLKPDSVYLDLFINDDEPKQKPATYPDDYTGADDIPF